MIREDLQLILFTPANEDVTSFLPQLCEIVETYPVGAVVVSNPQQRSEKHLSAAKQIITQIQDRSTAVLLEDEVELVQALQADGAHLNLAPDQIGQAVKILHPDFIVGAGSIATRHEAMLIGEAGVDYVILGDLETHTTQEQHELAKWWAQNIECDSALVANGLSEDQISAANNEFIALPYTVWKKPENLNKFVIKSSVQSA